MYKNFEMLCKRAGVSVYRVAQETGISPSTLSQWKSGAYSPKLPKLQRLAAYFGITVDELISGPKEKDPSTDHSHYVPVLGRVAAGVPIEMVEDVLGFEEVDNSVGEAFALKIDGDSMEPLLLRGDVVIVRRQEDVESGDVAIVSVDGEDATCKRIQKTPSGVMLVSVNPDYPPRFFSNEEIEELPVRILGRVVESRRTF